MGLLDIDYFSWPRACPRSSFVAFAVESAGFTPVAAVFYNQKPFAAPFKVEARNLILMKNFPDSRVYSLIGKGQLL